MANISTRKQIISLGAANAYNSVLFFILPVFLVRLLDGNEFGYYRLFWLTISTVMIVAPFGMSRSLQYFLPRVEKSKKGIYIYQSLFFLFFTGLICALLVSPLNPFLPDKISAISDYEALPSSFVFIWAVASLIEILPSADQRVNWQAGSVVLLATIRVIVTIFLAWYTNDVNMVFVALLIFAVLKLLVLFFYIFRYHGYRVSSLSRESYKEQLSHALPFGFTGMLNKARPITEQWVVAYLFSPAAFGAFSLAAVMMPLIHSLLKKTVIAVTLPKMSKQQSEGDISRVIELNNRGNIIIASVMFPLVMFLGVFAEDLVILLYTREYSAAAPVLQIYAISALIISIEISSLLIVFKQGTFVMKVSMSLIALAVVFSYLGARIFGMPGAALGSLLTVIISAILYYRRASVLTGCSLTKIQPWELLFKLIFAAFLSNISAYIVVDFINGNVDELAVLVIAAIISSTLYIGIMYLSGLKWLLKTFIGKGQWQY